MSLANFAASALVGRYGGQEQLGLYMLAWSAYMVALGLVKAMIWTPYTRRLPSLAGDDRPLYSASVTTHLAVVAAGVGLVLLAVAWGMNAAGQSSIACILGYLAPCCAAMLLREHVRRVCLARMASREAFWIDVLISAAQIAGLAGLAWAGKASAARGLVVIGAASALSALWIALRSAEFRWSLAAARRHWQENWAISRWVTGGALAVLVGNQGYRWLLPYLAGLGELGRLGSAQSVVQIANPVLLGVSNFLGPVTATVHAAQGVRGLWTHTVRSTLVLAACVAAVLLGVALLGPWVVQTVFERAAEGVTRTLLVTLAAGMLSEVLLVPIEFASLQLHKGRLLLLTAVTRLVVNVTVGFGLVAWMGAEGIGWGMLAGSCVSLAWQWASFSREAGDA